MLKILSGYRRRYSVQDIEREILMMNANSSERRDYALPIWTSESATHPMELENFFRQLWAANAYTFPVRAPVPSFLLASANDHFVNVSCSKTLADAWNCPLQIHPWAGHDLTLDDPEWVLEKLKQV